MCTSARALDRPIRRRFFYLDSRVITARSESLLVARRIVSITGNEVNDE
jgi:hypothetical protein